ncbi:nuclear transport factor 2 family protein [Streptomyces gibsoniae]|uniref:Nuclear transport factor 2 family protein n=1 Tax=Streptomyces gibsoniae TaxID=3075529 RepID=A0ABU2U3Q3_9ACTN|nr:nuclear transport factor 2 family protein [Streptomyces sp. DSM 41699]MDT0467834.1 nuclear transport factor 2 family protein [Streptomyces sp. DSM 41699]
MTAQHDHAEITLLVDRFFRALDERTFASGWTDDFLTEDSGMETPLGTFHGADAVRATEEALGRYDRTQHLVSGVVVDAAAGADRAAASWNALMTHVHNDATLREYGAGTDPLFTVGGRFDAELRRTSAGWRFSHVTVRPIWTRGRPPLGVGA